MNLTGQQVYQKGTKRKHDKPNDREFLAWIRTQPSALTGRTPCIAAHYRTSKNSGIGCKPTYSAIPLTQQEHSEQHRIGQFNFMPKPWWEGKVEYYVSQWKKQQKLIE